MDQTIYSKVKKMLRDVLDLPEARILPNTYLFRDLSLESGETLELTFMLEQEFSIKIGSQEIWNLPNVVASPYDLFNDLTVENIVDFVSAKLEKSEHRV